MPATAALTSRTHRPSRQRRAAHTTERFDAVGCLDNRLRHRGEWAEPHEPGRYLQLDGIDGSLLIPIDTDVMRVGRSLAADVHLDDASVSRRHAVIVMNVSGARVLDDRSTNGTFLNGRRVAHADLSDGDVISLGRLRMRFRVLDGTESECHDTRIAARD
jgi:FHA domain